MFFTKRKAILLFIICLIFFFLTYQDVKSSEITSGFEEKNLGTMSALIKIITPAINIINSPYFIEVK